MNYLKYVKNRLIKGILIIVSFLMIQLFACTMLKAQISNQISPQLMPSTPEASTLGSYGDVSVSKYTGKHQFKVPLYNVPLDEGSFPIDLFYNSGGIRVNEEASSIGLSWNISSGAVITRQINGFDDISDYGADGYIYSYPVSSIHYNEHRDRLVNGYTGNNPLDIEPDLFNVNLFGNTITFQLDKKGTENIIEAIPLNNKNVKITYDDTDKSISIIDDLGTKYIFSDHELTTTYRGSSGGSESSAFIETALQSVDKGRTKQKITSWYLSQIISKDKNVIDFSYEKGFFYTYPYFSNSIAIGVSAGPNPGVVSGVVSPGQRYACVVSGHESLNISSIEGDFGKVAFSYSTDRKDLIDESNHYQWPTGIIGIDALRSKRLYHIEITNNNNAVIKTIEFENDNYFNADKIGDDDQERYLRLKLDGLMVNGKNYQFQYIASNSLPAKDTKSLDFWGFYNGINNNTRIPSYSRYVYDYGWNNTNIMYYNGADRRSNYDYAKSGVLSRVIYPTGGSTSFAYEGNQVLVEIPVDIETLNYNYSYLEGLPNIDLNDFEKKTINPNQEFTIVKKTAEAIGGYNVSIRVTVGCGFNCDKQRVYNPILRITKSSGSFSQDVFTYSATSGSSSTLNTTLNLNPGTYQIGIINYNSNPNNPETIGLSASLVNSYLIDYPSYNSTNNYKIYEVGGLRIKEIRNFDRNNAVINKTEYQYTKERYGNIVSSGTLMDELVFHSKMGLFDYTPESYGNSITMASGNNLLTSPSAAGSHIGYTQVKERYYDGESYNGATISAFMNFPNFYTLRFIGTTPASNPANPQYNGDATGHFADVTYGNVYVIGIPPATAEYKNGKINMQSTYDKYNNLQKQTFYDYEDITVRNSGFLKVLWQGSIGSSVPPQTGGIVYSTNYSKSHRISLLSDESILMYDNALSYNVQNNRTYNANNYLSSLQKEIAREGESIIERTEYYYPGDIEGYQNLMSSQMLAKPVKIVKKKNNQIVQGTVNTYADFNINGQMIPKESSKLVFNNETEEYESKLEILDYSDKGKILEFRTIDGTSNEIKWEYNSMYPVLKFANAPANISSFINEALPAGYSSLSSFIDNMNNVENDESKQLLWVSFVDELRSNLPSMVSFEAFTYIPLVGITASGGSNQKTSFYRYDTFNRLLSLLDEEGNIVKQYDYHYAD